MPLKCTCMHAFGSANLFESFSCSLNALDHNGDVPVVAVGVVIVCMSGVTVVIGVLVRLVVPLKFPMFLPTLPYTSVPSRYVLPVYYLV